jgi:hypothetical protein
MNSLALVHKETIYLKYKRDKNKVEIKASPQIKNAPSYTEFQSRHFQFIFMKKKIEQRLAQYRIIDMTSTQQNYFDLQ